MGPHHDCTTIYHVQHYSAIHLIHTFSKLVLQKLTLTGLLGKVGADTGGEKNLSTSVTDSLCRKYINTKMQD